LMFAISALRNPLVNWREFVAGLFFLMSAFSKELGLVTFLLWLITILFARASRARFVAAVLISLFSIGVYAFMRSKAERAEVPPSRVATLAGRAALAAAALGEYAELIIYPPALRRERGAERKPLGSQSDSTAIFETPPIWRILAGILC